MRRRRGAFSVDKATTGRTLARTNNYVCESCKVRRALGEPKPNDSWAQRLHLTQLQIDLLLLAATEFELLSEDAGTVSNAVDFVDWCAPDALDEVRPDSGAPVRSAA
jgi:hypothetical protein